MRGAEREVVTAVVVVIVFTLLRLAELVELRGAAVIAVLAGVVTWLLTRSLDRRGDRSER